MATRLCRTVQNSSRCSRETHFTFDTRTVRTVYDPKCVQVRLSTSHIARQLPSKCCAVCRNRSQRSKCLPIRNDRSPPNKTHLPPNSTINTRQQNGCTRMVATERAQRSLRARRGIYECGARVANGRRSRNCPKCAKSNAVTIRFGAKNGARTDTTRRASSSADIANLRSKLLARRAALFTPVHSCSVLFSAVRGSNLNTSRRDFLIKMFVCC